MYSLAIYLYMLAVNVAALFNGKARQLVRGHRAVWRTLREKREAGRQYVWFHAASLGEFEQGRPLMERLRREHPELGILLTFFSPSGYEVRKDYDVADIVIYLPFDTKPNARKFMQLARPCMAFFIKYEFWKNYLNALRRADVPVYSVSSIFREGQVFFRWYGRDYAKVLRSFKHFFVQNETSRQLLARHGSTNVTVVGDTRMDRVLTICQQAKELPVVAAFAQEAKGHVLVAGSSWQPDEDILISYFNSHPEQRLILAPHVVNEAHLAEIESKLQRPSLRYTDATEESARQADCLIINCYGLLSSIYRYGQLAYVGGGFGVGIHNVPEAAVYGVPVFIGPNNQRFREAQELLQLGGCIEIRNQADFDTAMAHLTGDAEALKQAGQTAGSYIAANAGAADKIFAQIDFNTLPPLP